MAKVLTQEEALRISHGNIARAPNLNARGNSSKTPSKPANELEGLIRDKLPDPVRRHLIDVIIDRTDVLVRLLSLPVGSMSTTRHFLSEARTIHQFARAGLGWASRKTPIRTNPYI